MLVNNGVVIDDNYINDVTLDVPLDVHDLHAHDRNIGYYSNLNDHPGNNNRVRR